MPLQPVMGITATGITYFFIDKKKRPKEMDRGSHI